MELRACQKVGDAGVIGMCERLSGIHKLRKIMNLAEGRDENHEPQSEFERYQIFYKNKDFENQNNLEFLNLAYLKNVKNESMKAIAHNLFNKL